MESPYTRQEFKNECDINHIMLQYELTGEITHINESAPQYLDCSGEDFRAHMDYVAGAFSMFEELPAKMRARFDNDPAAFLDFCSHEKNRPEMAQMGLLSVDAAAAYATPQGGLEPTLKTPPSVPTEPGNSDTPGMSPS